MKIRAVLFSLGLSFIWLVTILLVEINESEVIEGDGPSTLGFSNIITSMNEESKLIFIGLNVAKAAVCAL